MNKLTFSRNSTKNKGFTLIELLLVLGIIAVLAIAAFIIYPKVQASSEANTEQSNITAIASGVKSLFAATGDYSDGGTFPGIAAGAAGAGGMNTTLISSKVIPKQMVSGAATMVSSFGQTVDVDSLSAGTAPDPTVAGRGFQIAYANVSSAVCVKLATGAGSQALDVWANGVDLETLNVTTGQYSVDQVKVAANCSAAASVSMDFIFD